jgi:hypothetical protein
MFDESIQQELEKLTGKNAGQICYANTRFDSHLHQIIIEAAEVMWEDGRSIWEFAAVWPDGTTIWEKPDGSETATVSRSGEIFLEQNES